MFVFCHKDNYTETGVWPTASEKDGTARWWDRTPEPVVALGEAAGAEQAEFPT